MIGDGTKPGFQARLGGGMQEPKPLRQQTRSRRQVQPKKPVPFGRATTRALGIPPTGKAERQETSGANAADRAFKLAGGKGAQARLQMPTNLAVKGCFCA